jgi:two-component system, OmpR family, sensor histidine kinase RstB
VNSIFFRIYGGMLLVLVTVSILGVLSIQLINSVRAEDYRERIAWGTFRLMADNLAPMDDTERLRALATWTRLIGVPLELQPLSSLGLDAGSSGRLQQGHVLVQPEEGAGLHVFSLVDAADGTVLTTSILRLSEQLGRATLYLVADELVRHPDAEMPGQLQKLRREKGFGYPLQLVSIREADIDPDQRRRLEESDTVMTLGPDGDSVLLYMKIPDSDWVLGLGPLFQMNDYPPEMLLITALLVLTFSGLFIYLLVRHLEHRLSGLEVVASRITRGNLDARVVARTNDSVGRLGRTFNEMASHLQRLMRLQREMIGAVSHELRTPVARLRFGLEMVESATNEDDRRRHLQGMDADLSELDKLVDEILTYARLEQGSPSLTLVATDVPALVDRVVDELSRLGLDVELTHLDQSVGRAARVEAEPRFLHRAITNLVTNAMRHAATRVQITTRVVSDECMVLVEDDGPGIPGELRERIFTPFLRLDDSRTRASGGYGLGLAIVRRVMYWHGGQARATESTALGGAAFVLAWPVRRR